MMTEAKTGGTPRWLGAISGRSLPQIVRLQALVILGLAGLAVAQPMLDLFGSNPPFFVTGNYSSGQIVAFALIITLLPPLVFTAITVAATAIDRRVGTVMFGACAGLLAAVFMLGLLRTVGLDAAFVALPVAAAFGAAVGYVVLWARGAQLFTSYLAAANLLFLGSFVFMSPTSDLITGSGPHEAVHDATVADPKGPVVVVVLDEMAAASVMREDGSINAERYPGFAELASVSTWFRNASSQHHSTHRAVPSLLTGRVGSEDALPTYLDQPRNLFTLLGNDMPVDRYESVTNMCPPPICEPPPRLPLTRAMEDAALVFGHRVLPSTLRDGLVPIDDSWGDYGSEDDTGTSIDTEGNTKHESYGRWENLDATEKSPAGQVAAVEQQIDQITAEPGLHVIHPALPHRPWTLSRTGVSTSYLPDYIGDLDDVDQSDDPTEFQTRMMYQLYSMQLGATDAAIGDLVGQLRQSPAWDDTTLVVTSDHGYNFTPPDLGREYVTEGNQEEVLRVPLFIKAPGQTDGEIRDDVAQTIDVVPSIVDLLDVDVSKRWKFDGHSLYDGSEPHTDPIVSDDVDAVIDIAERRHDEFPFGDDWTAVAAVGDNGDLVGRQVTAVESGDDSVYQVSFDQVGLFRSLPTDDGTMPFVLAGKIAGPSGDDPPPQLLAAVNGRFAGVVGEYQQDGDGWAFTGYVADLYREGRNQVALYEVDRDGADVTVHPLTTAPPG